jgi:hypothetical protein
VVDGSIDSFPIAVIQIVLILLRVERLPTTREPGNELTAYSRKDAAHLLRIGLGRKLSPQQHNGQRLELPRLYKLLAIERRL